MKTLAAALTSKSHSLASLSELLKVPTPKEESDEHGGALTPDYVRYGLRDVQTTWECFDALAQRFATFGLSDTGLYDLYSEASLGKAYLRTMKIKPWREVQPDFPPELVGQILSAYYGGRAEVHIRRQITPVVHCDFLSMYPTVCTLMGLWGFVRANGVTYRDDTPAVKALLASSRDDLVERLRTKDGWNDLAALVQVRPKRDLFPVRAQYPGGDTLNIGLNYLSADEPQWFTLADVLASKILTGKTPEVVAALRFEPKEQQTGLKPIDVAGQTIDPATDDFYQRLIIHRNAIKAKLDDAKRADKPALKSDEQGDQNPRQRDQLWDFRRVECRGLCHSQADGRPWRAVGNPPLQVQVVREARRIFSPAACHADHWRGAIDAGACRASGHRTGARLGLLRHRQHRHRQRTQPFAGRVHSERVEGPRLVQGPQSLWRGQVDPSVGKGQLSCSVRTATLTPLSRPSALRSPPSAMSCSTGRTTASSFARPQGMALAI